MLCTVIGQIKRKNQSQKCLVDANNIIFRLTSWQLRRWYCTNYWSNSLNILPFYQTWLRSISSGFKISNIVLEIFRVILVLFLVSQSQNSLIIKRKYLYVYWLCRMVDGENFINNSLTTPVSLTIIDIQTLGLAFSGKGINDRL